MAILKVARMGHPVLRAKARALERAEIRKPAFQHLIDDLMDTMDEYRGVGLAAPQVHVGLRLFVAVLDADDTDGGEREPVVVVNPEITPVGTDLVDGWE
jgi:peptide deformylase